jgi:microcystin-dependent protein
VDPILGTIILFAGNFPPRGWAFCHGQLLSIAQHTALFSILGTTYGGNGQTTFALPDLRGRVPLGAGQGPGLSTYALGESGGVEAVTLLSTQMPPHTHTLLGSSEPAHLGAPENAFLAAPRQPVYARDGNVPMASGVIEPTGGGLPHENRQPYVGLNYIIAMEGIFPSRP